MRHILVVTALLFACAPTATTAATPTASSSTSLQVAEATAAAPTTAARAEQPAMSLYDLDLVTLHGERLDPASLRGKVLLFVNVASKCGFTPQYEGLQALYETYVDKGLVVIGIPCNQFGGQEPGSAEQIASFCKMNYGVTFPLLGKQDVNGADRSPLYSFLIGSDVGKDKNVKWNFEKFIVSPTGEVVARFGSSITPDDPQLRAAIESILPPGT